MKKALIFMTILVVVAAIGVGFLQYERARKYDYNSLFPYWMESEYECGNTKFFEYILNVIAPDTLKKINDTDAIFFELEKKEHDGTLTVGERQKYLADDLRIKISKGLFNSYVQSEERYEGLIKRCSRPEILYMEKGKVTAYCKGRVYYDFSHLWPILYEKYYEYLFWNSQADEFIDQMRQRFRDDYEYEQQAKETVLAKSASQISERETGDAIHQEFLNLKCGKERDNSLTSFQEKATEGHEVLPFCDDIAQCISLADRGNIDAQILMALRYEAGVKVPKDMNEAMKWLRMAARQGDVGAQILLGSTLAEGVSVPANYDEALYWFNEAAKQDSKDAFLALSVMYRLGMGVEKSYTKSMEYLFRARQGDD